MELGPRIEARLRMLGLSQAELARRARIPQTTVNGLIRGHSRSTPHLIRIARELKTTPAYLTGETNDPDAELPEFLLTADERAWIGQLRDLEPGDREAILHLTQKLAPAETANARSVGGALSDRALESSAEQAVPLTKLKFGT